MTTIISSFPISQKFSWREKIAYSLENTAFYLQKPAYYASEPFLRAIFTPIRPGENGNWNSALFEKIWRVAIVAFCISKSPVILSLALMGAGLYKTADFIKQNPFTYLKGNAGEEIEGDQQKLMTLNACMLSGGLPIPLGGMRPSRMRINDLCEKIIKQAPDVVMMQEVDFNSAKSIFRELDGYYPHGFTRIGPDRPFLGSGLFVLSKYPIQKVGHIPFPNQYGMNRRAFWMETRNSIYITTHLEFGENPEKRKKRKKQFELIETKIKELETSTKKPCFLLGDLNIDRAHGQEYQDLKISSNFYDPYFHKYSKLNETIATCTNVICNYILGKNPPKTPWEVIDYALLHNKNSKIRLTIDKVSMYDNNKPYEALTDHHGLLLTVNR